MIPTSTRRQAIAGLSAIIASRASAARAADASPEIARIERDLGGRVGLAGQTLRGGPRIAYRPNERFAMCSTFKLLLAAAVLRRVDQGAESLTRRIAYSSADLLSYAPATKARVAEGAMSVMDLCAAAVTLSDNTAANLLLKSVGGPAAVTAFARGLGDPVTRLDRNEPMLNMVPPGDPRDTTSPAAMVDDVRRLVFGEALSGGSRRLLTQWLEGCTTGDGRIRAGAPAGARVGDKTGTWSDDHLVTANDVAVIWPVRGTPILLAVYVYGSHAGGEATDEAIAQITRIACAALGAG